MSCKIIISFFLITFCVASSKSIAQNKLEIVIQASFYYNESSNQGFQKIIEKLKAFKPAMVFGEYIPAKAYANLD